MSRPSATPTEVHSGSPSDIPSDGPSMTPSITPTEAPSVSPSEVPSTSPSDAPSEDPSTSPSDSPTDIPPPLQILDDPYFDPIVFPPVNDVNDYEQLPDDPYADMTGNDDGAPVMNNDSSPIIGSPIISPPTTDITDYNQLPDNPDVGGPTTILGGPSMPYGSVENGESSPQEDNIFIRNNVI